MLLDVYYYYCVYGMVGKRYKCVCDGKIFLYTNNLTLCLFVYIKFVYLYFFLPHHIYI